MWAQKSNGNGERRESRNTNPALLAVAIHKDKKNSHHALKWAIDNLLQKGQTVVLLHVKANPTPIHLGRTNCLKAVVIYRMYVKIPILKPGNFSFPSVASVLIQCKDVVLEENDVAKALIEYATHAVIEVLIIGASTRASFLSTDITGTISKNAPDFCNVYVISKNKISSMRSASHPAPPVSPLRSQILNQSKPTPPPSPPPEPQIVPAAANAFRGEKWRAEPLRQSTDSKDCIRSPFGRKGINKLFPALPSPTPDSDISFVSSGRPSTVGTLPESFDYQDSSRTSTGPRLSNLSDYESYLRFESLPCGSNSMDLSSPLDFPSASPDRHSNFSGSTDDVEAEMRRLKLELKQTMEMYSTACKEALTAKQKAKELQLWKMEEERRLEEARLAKEAALVIAEQEKAKNESCQGTSRKKKALDALASTDFRYRKYTIEEVEAATEFFSEALKIGEGGYGPVFKGHLDHTLVAIKVLRPDAAQGRSQFQREVEVLSCIRHPNGPLIGSVPGYGCLVYEFMAYGSLEDRLFRRGNTPTLSWQLRFRIAAEIGTALLFLHQTKPEPIVHRDLKPANILIDRNFVSKISDVGLARLVPPSVADSVTQYWMTATAGTFCYIDPDTSKQACWEAIEEGTFDQMLDPTIHDWPVQDALSFAKIALSCAELRRKDRPDLGKVVLPELNRLRSC
ncbi:transcription factor MYB1R1-like isoform X1 [Hibiscus syriacus]|uniref:RING-type E3 ubiquitin transferase n=1 Tax=Hibiscus syriacus TaxID=106335 RepID=A0A6A2XNC2_HIBSY|nr:transcription factor MYB1R1-like isoform X1 [Hibiscus syriacus]